MDNKDQGEMKEDLTKIKRRHKDTHEELMEKERDLRILLGRLTTMEQRLMMVMEQGIEEAGEPVQLEERLHDSELQRTQ